MDTANGQPGKTSSRGDEYIDLKSFVQTTVRHWKLILASVIFFLAAAACYCIFSVPVYMRSAVIMVGGEEHGGVNNISALFENRIISTSSGVENDMFVLGSRNIAEKTAARVNFESGSTLTADEIRKGVRISNPVKGSTLVRIDYLDTDTARADLVLSALIDEYMNFNLACKKYEALVTKRYADSRIAELQNGKTETKPVSGDKTPEVLKKQFSDKAMINILNGIGAFLGREMNRNKVIPEVSATGDVQLDNLIEKYNELQVRRTMLVENAESESAAEIDSALADMRNSILDGIGIRRHVLEKAVADAVGNSREPEALQTAEEYGLNKSVCLHLMEQKENAEIRAAVAEAEVTLIDAPDGDGSPVKPNKVAVFLIALVAGIVLPYIILYLRCQFKTR